MNYSRYRTLLRYLRVRNLGPFIDPKTKRKQAKRKASLSEDFIRPNGDLTEQALYYLARGAGHGWFRDLESFPGVTRQHGFYSREDGSPFVVRLDFDDDRAKVTVFGPGYSAWVGEFAQDVGRQLFLSLNAETVEACEGLRRIR